MSTFLYEIQAIVRDYLKTDPYFFDIHIVDDDAIDLNADTRKALTENFLTGEKAGICIAIRMLEGTVSGADVPGIHFMPATIGMEVIENPVVNRASGGSGKKCLVVAETLLAVMRGFNNSEIPNAKVWIADGENPIRLDNPDWECTSYLCLLATQGGSTDTTAIVDTPIITDAANLCTITCGTAGSAIYYTVDGTRPLYQGVGHAGNNGTLYAGAFSTAALDPGTIIMARGFKDGLRGSLIASVTHEGEAVDADGINYQFRTGDVFCLKDGDGNLYRLDIKGTSGNEGWFLDDATSSSPASAVVAAGSNYEFSTDGEFRILNVSGNKAYALYLEGGVDMEDIQIPNASLPDPGAVAASGVLFRFSGGYFQWFNTTQSTWLSPFATSTGGITVT